MPATNISQLAILNIIVFTLSTHHRHFLLNLQKIENDSTFVYSGVLRGGNIAVAAFQDAAEEPTGDAVGQIQARERPCHCQNRRRNLVHGVDLHLLQHVSDKDRSSSSC